MDPISRPVPRTDFEEKVDGSMRFCADMAPEGLLYARTLRSARPRARILSIRLPVLPEGYLTVDRSDVPGINRIPLVFDDQPFLAEDTVRYVGEPILLLVGPDRDVIGDLLAAAEVTYQDLPPILSMDEASSRTGDFISDMGACFVAYAYDKGTPDEAIARAVRVVEDVTETGWQEQAYLEPQSMLGEVDGNRVVVSGSMQCPYYIHEALMRAFGWPAERVRVKQLPTGGGFGGKEEFPSLIGVHAALAAWKAGRPVRIVYDRAEDIACTTKRHPSRIRIRSHLDADGNPLAQEMDVSMDGGAYAGLSSVVLQRMIFTVGGVYRVPNIKVRGRVYATDHVPSGAFRGFGGPQALFAIETHMEHIARELGVDPLAYRRRHLLEKGDTSTTGGVFHHPILLDRIADEIDALSGFTAKRGDPAWKDGRLRGIGVSLFLHGCGFTGSGEKDMLHPRVRLVRNRDGTVSIFVSSTEIGQGAGTTLRKIVARTLGLPLGQVEYRWPDTDQCPDSGPTVASRTAMIVGRLLQECAQELLTHEEPEADITRNYHYLRHLAWDKDTLSGNAYPEYSWGANAVETEVDPVTGQWRVTGIWCVFDIGTPLDERIVRGQIEGGMVQGLGYGGREGRASREGHLMQASFTDYMIPTACDFPAIEARLVENPYAFGPFGARGLGELSLVGAAPALALSIADAIGYPVERLPVTPEHVLTLLRNRDRPTETDRARDAELREPQGRS